MNDDAIYESGLSGLQFDQLQFVMDSNIEPARLCICFVSELCIVAVCYITFMASLRSSKIIRDRAYNSQSSDNFPFECYILTTHVL